jgi:hypothetical protein
MKAFLVGVTLAALGAAPAFAQFFGPAPSYTWSGYQSDWNAVPRQVPARKHARSAYRAYGAVTPFGNPGVSGTGGRAAAIHACSGQGARYNEYTWGDMEFQQYRACMAQHGQVE